MKIYTKTGDDGTTGLYGNVRVSKSSLRIDAIGDVDELNAMLGRACVEIQDGGLASELEAIQCRLFDVGAELANATGYRFGITEDDVRRLESSMDVLEADLPPLRAFILPGGSKSAGDLHIARTVCRRAERKLIALDGEEPLRGELRQFMNRLSDWLFIAARFCNFSERVIETEWRSRTAGKL